MNLTERARRDIKNQSSNKDSGWGVQLEFISPDGTQLATIAGIHTQHHLGVSLEGTMVNAKTCFVSFSEDLLKETNPSYPIRNAGGEVNFKKHKVDVIDSTGNKKNYQVQAWFPDEKLGYILLTLEDYTTT